MAGCTAMFRYQPKQKKRLRRTRRAGSKSNSPGATRLFDLRHLPKSGEILSMIGAWSLAAVVLPSDSKMDRSNTLRSRLKFNTWDFVGELRYGRLKAEQRL